MDVDIYETDAAAFAAAAELVAETLRAAASRGRATVALSGISHVEAAGAIAAGAGVAADTVGRAASSSTNVVGIAIHSASAAGQLVPVLLRLGN